MAKMRFRRLTKLMGTCLVTVLAAAGLVACGSDSGDSDTKVLRIVIGAQPDHLGLLLPYGPYKALQDLAGDTLTVLDPKAGTLQPQLATSWEQKAPDTWVFNLRQGVKFHDGTDFDAEAAAWAINVQTDSETSVSRVVRYAADLNASAIDKHTLQVKCPAACPILDRISPHIQFQSPKYMEQHPDDNNVWPVGTGPYYLDEWRQGEYVVFKRFADYWGDDPYFDEVRGVWRLEPSVRAAMVSNGEADLAVELGPLEADQVPQAITVDSIDSAAIRFRTRGPDLKLDPVWGDVRFRQALMHAIDCEAMVKTLMKGTTKCSPVPMNPASVGWVPDPVYAYDPTKARALLDAVLGPGKGIDIKVYYETGDIPSTWVDALISYWNDVGVRAKFNPVEGARNDEVRLPGPNGVPVDSYMLPGHTNDLFDASVPLAYLDCTVENSYSACDPQFQKDRAAASALSGDERKKAMEEMVRKYVIGGAQFNGLWLTPYVFGASDRLVWPNPQMLKIRPDQMSFNGS